jgi:hypothetical protein
VFVKRPFWWMTCLLGVLLGCETSKSDMAATARADALESIDRIKVRMEPIDDAVRSIQERRTIELAAPNLSRSEPFPPSEAHDRLVNSADVGGKLFVQLLRMAEMNAPLPTRLMSLGCLGDWDAGITWEDGITAVPQASKSIAKALDAVALIQTARCSDARPETQIHIPFAPKQTNRDLLAIVADAEADERRKASRPFFLVPESDLSVMMIGQGYRFADTKDQAISIPKYVADRFRIGTERIKTVLLPLATVNGKVTVFFDRTRTLGGQDLMGESPLGWFAGYADPARNEIYISPTLVRAAFIACGSRLHYDTTEIDRLTGLRKEIEDRRSTPNDAAATVAGMGKIADRFDRCLDQEVDFLLGHELAHAILKIHQEARADCVGRAVAAAMGHSSGGVFESLIFGLVESEDVSLLGPMSAENRRRLACRAKLHRETEPGAQVPLATAVDTCRQMATVCE